MLYSIALIILCIAYTVNSQINTANCAEFDTLNDCASIPGACDWIVAAVQDDYCRCASASSFDILFGIDRSGSIGTQNFNTLLQFIDEFTTHGINIMESRIGFTMFSENVNVLSPIKYWNEPEALSTFITDIPYTGGVTNTSALLDSALIQFENIADPDRDQLLLIFTDGNPYARATPGNPGSGGAYSICGGIGPLDEDRSDDLSDAGIHTTIVAIGANINPGFMQCIVTDQNEDWIEVDDFTEASFDGILETLSETACPYTTMNPSSSPSDEPTAAPSAPSQTPTSDPTDAPTPDPSKEPTVSPSVEPTASTGAPSTEPTTPTAPPTLAPTCYRAEPSIYYVIRNFYGGILTDNGVQTNNVHFECELTENNQIWERIDADTIPACIGGNADFVFRNIDTTDYLYTADNKIYAKLVPDPSDPGVCWNVYDDSSEAVNDNFAFSSNYKRLKNAYTDKYPKSGQDCHDLNGITAVYNNTKDDSSLFWFLPMDFLEL